MTHFHVTICSWNSPPPLTGNTGLYLSKSVSAKQYGWLQSLWTYAGTCVHCTNTCPRYQPLWSVTWSSASLTHGQACHRTSPTKQLVNGESSCVQAWRQIDITWTSPNWKRLFSEPAHYTTGSFQSHKQSTEENTLLRVISITAS